MVEGSISMNALNEFIKEAACKSKKQFAKDYLLYLLESEIITLRQYEKESGKVDFVINEIEKIREAKGVPH